MNKAFEGALVGFLAPFQGLVLLFSSVKLFFLASLPFVIASLVLGFGFFWAYYNLGEIVTYFLAQFIDATGLFFSIIAPFLTLLTWAGFLSVAFVVAYILINIFAGPFLSLLAEETFRRRDPQRLRRGSVRLIVKMFGLSLIKMSFFLLLAAVNLVLWFFPPLNILGTLLILLTIAFDCVDYSLEMDFLSLTDRFRFFRVHFWHFFGLAMAILVSNLIPGGFFVLLPAFVAGAAKMYMDLAPQE